MREDTSVKKAGINVNNVEKHLWACHTQKPSENPYKPCYNLVLSENSSDIVNTVFDEDDSFDTSLSQEAR